VSWFIQVLLSWFIQVLLVDLLSFSFSPVFIHADIPPPISPELEHAGNEDLCRVYAGFIQVGSMIAVLY